MGYLKKSMGQIVNSQLSPLNLRLLKLSHYSQLVSDNDRLTNKNDRLVSENARLANKNAQLASENTRLTNKNNQLANKNAQLVSANAQLVSTNSRLVSENTRLVSENTRLFSENANASNELWTWLRQTYSIKTVIDVGANDGKFARFLARNFSAEETYVFEPLTSHIPALESQSSSIPNLKIFNVALSDYQGNERFYQNSYSPSSSLLRVSEIHKKEFPHTAGETETIVKVSRLDDLVSKENLKQDIFIKIDAQGVEEKVIKGGEKVFSLAKCVLVEMSFVLMFEKQPLFEEVHSLLVDLGYRFAGIKNQIISREGQPLFAHCLYLRSSCSY